MTSSLLVADIETWPREETFLKNFAPARIPWTDPGAFDPFQVKTGNLKDPDKIAEKIRQAERTWADDVAVSFREHEEHQDAIYEKFVQRATLDPRYSRVFAIGYYSNNGFHLDYHDDPDDEQEAQILTNFWNQSFGILCNWCLFSFDLPFLIRRTWILKAAGHKLDIPYWCKEVPIWRNPNLVDLKDKWTLQNAMKDNGNSLSLVAKIMGLDSQKFDTEDLLPYQLRESKLKEYCQADVEMVWQLAQIMGV